MIDVGLKEWAAVWRLVLEGRFALLLRKGGIHELGGPGRFAPEHERFALFPAWEHQRPERLKPAYRDRVEAGGELAAVDIAGYADAGRIWRLTDRAAFDALDDLHPWTPEQIDMRFGYKPERPLYLMAVRAYRLPAPRRVPNRDSYAGCRSWVPLAAEDAIDPAGAVPAMAEESWRALLERVDRALA